MGELHNGQGNHSTSGLSACGLGWSNVTLTLGGTSLFSTVSLLTIPLIQKGKKATQRSISAALNKTEDPHLSVESASTLVEVP